MKTGMMFARWTITALALLGAVTAHAVTIQERVDAAKPGDTVLIPAGIYRECVTLRAPITLAGQPGAEIRGSDVWTGWDAAGPLWRSRLTVPEFYHYGYGNQQSKWPEQVFLNDRELTHVAADPKPGEFALDALRHVLLADSPQNATVEVTMRQTWVVIESDHVTIRDFRMRHAASDAQANAAIPFHKFSHGTVERCVLSDTHGCVVSLGSGNDNRVLQCEIFHGGQTGVHASEGGNGDVISENKIHDNDRCGFDAGWDGGGIKICKITNAQVIGNELWNNRGPGLWCDVDCGDLNIRDNRCHDNGGAGIHYEISRTGHIVGNVCWNNGLAFSEWGWGAGILLSSSRDCEVDHNLIAWNPDGLSIVSADRGQQRWNEVVGNSIHDNTIIGTDADPRDPKHNNIYALAFLQDWKGILAAPGSNNRAVNNLIYLPNPERNGRFAFVEVLPSLEALNRIPGCSGNRYITLEEALTALKAADVPGPAGGNRYSTPK